MHWNDPQVAAQSAVSRGTSLLGCGGRCQLNNHSRYNVAVREETISRFARLSLEGRARPPLPPKKPRSVRSSSDKIRGIKAREFSLGGELYLAKLNEFTSAAL